MTLHDVSLSDRFDLSKRTVLLGGIQALVRMLLMQKARDEAAARPRHRRLRHRLPRLAARRRRASGHDEGEQAAWRGRREVRPRAPSISSAAWRATKGLRLRMKSGYETPSGHSTRSAFAVSRRRSRRSGSATGTVRSRPTSPLSISSAAAIPVMSEICAFHCSTGSGARNWSPKPPSRWVITCSGIARLTPPRCTSRCPRRRPTSRRRRSCSSAVPPSSPAGRSRSRAAPGCGRVPGRP